MQSRNEKFLQERTAGAYLSARQALVMVKVKGDLFFSKSFTIHYEIKCCDFNSKY